MVEKKGDGLIEESRYVIHSKEKALRNSILEGSSQNVANNLGGSFMTPFMLAIGGNSFHVGLLRSLAGLVGPLGQLKGSKLLETKSRKKTLMSMKLIGTLLYLPIIGLAYLFWKGMLLDYLPYTLILIWAVFLHFSFGVGYVSWLSWMGDIVPTKQKGKYYAIRNRISGVAGLVTFLLGAFVLDLFKTKGFVLLGFTILFSTSIIFRVISRNLTRKIFNPQFRVKKKSYFSFISFIKRYDNFGKFAFFQALFFFSVMLSAPFFAVYMLEDLGFSYFVFTSVSVSPVIFYLFFAPLAGKFSDKYGNIKLLYLAAVLFPFVPLLWVFLKTPLLLIFLPGLISGIANSAYLIGVNNFSYDSVPAQKRGLCFSYSAILIGVGTLAGSLIGGFLIEYAGITFIKPIFFVFLLSVVLMILTSLFFLPKINDEREIEKVKGFSLDLHHPFKMVHSDLVWFKNFNHGG